MDTTDVERESYKPDPTSKSDRVREMLANGLKPGEIAKKVGCSRNLVYLIKNTGVGSGKPLAQRGKRAPLARKTSIANLTDIVAAVQTCERDVVKMRAALESVRSIVTEALG